MIIIVDYGVGNMGSIVNMCRKIGVQSVISSNAPDIIKADKLILPGIGRFDEGMGNLARLGLEPVLKKKVIEDKTPILGICLGMQLLGRRSQEGKLEGLGWIDAEAVKFNNSRLKIPHMGWNSIEIVKNTPLFNGLQDDARFYFLHSYYIVCNRQEDVASKTYYGDEFVSSIQKDNIYGVQFHPEKSHKFGMKLLENFIKD